MASRILVDQNLLSDLVERRIEAPDVEYKRWMPLTENLERANIARHICALANSGGGWLVFGFEDDGAPSEPHPDGLSAYGQDAINGIAAKYLEPSPHCIVQQVKATSGRIYPVVRVPTHGTVPLCAKSDGPQNDKKKPEGIAKGNHYIRIAGPQSVPITGPEMWRDVIRRCVLAERNSLLNSIGQLFDGPAALPAVTDELESLVDFVLEQWNGVEPEGWPVKIAENRVAFAFRLLTADGKPPAPISLAQLGQSIREGSFASTEAIRDGASFHESRDDRPRVALFKGREGYQSLEKGGAHLLPKLWLIREDGIGVEVTGIPEDSQWMHEAIRDRGRTRPWPPGQRFAPTFQADTVAQRVAFVAKLAESYPDAQRCELMIDYIGLKGRSLDEPAPGVYFSIDRTSAVDARRVAITVGVAALSAELAETTSELIGPLFRLFDNWDVGSEYVRARLENRGR